MKMRPRPSRPSTGGLRTALSFGLARFVRWPERPLRHVTGANRRDRQEREPVVLGGVRIFSGTGFARVAEPAHPSKGDAPRSLNPGPVPRVIADSFGFHTPP
jgi:hypothetical protein